MADTRVDAAAYGGEGWTPRNTSLHEEIGGIWHRCGVTTEWTALKAVLLHRPGPELDAVGDDVNATLMLRRPDAARARAQHDALVAAYRDAGVTVHLVEPARTPPPNQMFVADLMFMTPQGAIVGRPASTVRAGEERWVTRRLADLGIPILMTVHGTGAFEGADAAWLDPRTAVVATGLRTNREGARQVSGALRDVGAAVINVELPRGTMHLMGQLRIVDRDLAFVWAGRVPDGAVAALGDRGFTVLPFPDEEENRRGFAHNVVTLGPRRILMPAGCPKSEAAYARAGVTCVTVEVDELVKAAGGIGCLTGIVEREPA